MLHSRDKFVNWYVPDKQARAALYMPMRVYCSKNRNTITVSGNFADQLTIGRIMEGDTTILRAAFSLDEETPFVTFNPKNGVPFIKLVARGDAKSPSVASTALAREIYRVFKLNKRCRYYDFDLVEWQRLNGMLLYKIVVQEGQCDDKE